MTSKSKHFFLLLGAGASNPANIPLVKEFINDFKRDMGTRSNSTDIRILITTLEKIINKWKEKKQGLDIDLEILYEVLYQINRPNIHPIAGNITESFFPRGSETVFLEAELMGYIQKRCLISDHNKVEYLAPLLNFFEISPTLDIITLNYDTTIETLCISKNIHWTDGFDSKGNWNPRQFHVNQRQKMVRLFKLHGSVSWYHGPLVKAKYKRILESDLRAVGRKMHRAFTPTIDALMIYPGIGKQVIFGPYIEMMAHFRKLAFSSELCISIGYSFSDPHIKGIILDHLHLNPKLKLVIVNPRAKEISINIAMESGLPWDSQHRIIPVPIKIQKALQNNYFLKRTKDWLEGKLTKEEKSSINLAVKKFQTRFRNKQIEKISNSPVDLWAIAIEQNAKYAYLTQISNGQLLRLNLKSWKWDIVADGLRRALGVTIDPSEDCLYVVENEYQLKKNEHHFSEKEKRLLHYIQNYEGYGRLWKIFLNSPKFGMREPITYLCSKDSDPALQSYQHIKSQMIWKKIPGVLRWPEGVIVEEPKKKALIAESHRLCRIDLENGTVKSALYIPLCMNLLGVVFEKEDRSNVILLESGWWELERGRVFSTTGYGRLLRGNMKNQEVHIISSGFSKARGLALIPKGKNILFGQNHPYPYGCICEVDLASGQILRTWKGLDEPRALAVMPDSSFALVTTRVGLYAIKL